MNALSLIRQFLFTGLLIAQPVTILQAAELLVVESDDCPYCLRFHAEIAIAYPKTEEGKTAPLRLLDISNPMPDEYSDIKPARVTPTFILVDNGREVDRLIGYPGDEYFWFLLGQMLDKL
jgi:thioredoxin-related protein